jgi:hypothetical protein
VSPHPAPKRRIRPIDLEAVGVTLAQLTAISRSLNLRLEDIAQQFAEHLGHDLELAPVEHRSKLVDELEEKIKDQPFARDVAKSIAAWMPSTSSPTSTRASSASESELDGAARALMNVLAAVAPRALNRRELGHRAIYAPKSRHLGNVIGSMRSAGFIGTIDGELVAMKEGLEVHGKPTPLLTAGELVDAWRTKKLSGGAGTILQIFAVAKGRALSKREVAERSGYAATSRHFGNLLGELRSAEILEGKKVMRIAPWFIESEART